MTLEPSRLAFAAALLLMLVACGGSGAETDTESGSAGTTSTADVSGNTPPAAPSAVTALEVAYTEGLSNSDPRFPEPLIDTGRVLYGLPAPDGIPAIDTPQFVPLAEAMDWLTGQEAVVVVEHNDEVRAYPVRVLMNHEIVNDEIGGDPVAVTYCPLCNSALSFIREVDGEATTFGVSGMLFNSALIMYDRLTETLWLHYTGEAVVGERVGDRLQPVSTGLLSYDDVVANHPEALILSPDNRDRYGRNPYRGYDTVGTEPFLFNGVTDPRAQSKQRVVGVAVDGAAKAWTTAVLQGGLATVTEDVVGQTPVVIFWKSGQVSALSGGSVFMGDVVGSSRVYVPEADGQALTFRVEADTFVDNETSSTWNIFGEAVSGPLEGAHMEQVQHLDTFWFAWSSYQPTTDLVTSEGTIPPSGTS